MTASAPTQVAENDLAFAFGQGLPSEAVIRLLQGNHTAADRAMYYRCDWWAAKKAQALDVHGRACMLCDSPLALQIHHRPAGYRNLFREQPKRHLVVVCSRCHRHHHRK